MGHSLFEVIRGEQVIMHTNEVSCIPDKDTLMSLRRGGHRFRLSGKIASLDSILNYLETKAAQKQ